MARLQSQVAQHRSEMRGGFCGCHVLCRIDNGFDVNPSFWLVKTSGENPSELQLQFILNVDAVDKMKRFPICQMCAILLRLHG